MYVHLASTVHLVWLDCVCLILWIITTLDLFDNLIYTVVLDEPVTSDNGWLPLTGFT